MVYSNFDDELLEAHMQTLKELVQRDKNRPAVVMWSIGNEPQSQKQVSAHYFEYYFNPYFSHLQKKSSRLFFF